MGIVHTSSTIDHDLTDEQPIGATQMEVVDQGEAKDSVVKSSLSWLWNG